MDHSVQSAPSPLLRSTSHLPSYWSPLFSAPRPPPYQASSSQAASLLTISQPAPSFQAVIRKRSASRLLFHSSSQPTPSYMSTSQPAISFQNATKKRGADMQWQNFQKSHLTPSFHSTSQSIRSVHSTSQHTLSFQDTSHPVSSFQDKLQTCATRKYATGRESTQHWTVVATDAEENRKKLKGKVRDVLDLIDMRVVLDFDTFDQPNGEAQDLLAGFIGLLASDCSLFPINFVKWLKLPMTYFDEVIEKIIKVVNVKGNKEKGVVYIGYGSQFLTMTWKAVRESTIDESEVSLNDVVGRVQSF